MSPDVILTERPIGSIVESDHGRHGLGTAVFDAERRYRYRLSRVWDSSLPRVVWCMVNPSTASASISDPTLDRVIGFARRWGFGASETVNLFALRSPHPRDLTTELDPVGPGNDEAIFDAVAHADLVIAAWGNNGTLTNPATGAPRCDEVGQLLSDSGINPRCLRVTKLGQPAHPLYVPGEVESVPWRIPGRLPPQAREDPGDAPR